MILLHTSDWHLGKTDGQRSLYEDQRFFIDRICDIITENRVDAVLLAGDVYDRALASAEAIGLYDYAVTRICRDLGVKAAVIAGNHDGAERLASCGALLSGAGLHVAGALAREPAVIPFADTEVFLLPWISEEKVKSVFPERREEIGSLEDAYRVAADAMSARFTPGKRHVLLAHAFITNAETSVSDRAAEIGLATQVPLSVFHGFDYAALGHIHKPQDVGAFARYAGTPMPYSFGREETQQKSVTLLDTSTMERRVIPLPLLHRRRTLTGTLDELLAGPGDEDVRTGYVYLNITDDYAGPENQSALRAVYPNCLAIDGLRPEREDATVTLTAEALNEMETDPVAVFRYFCGESFQMQPDERLTELFRQAVQAAEEEENA